MGRPGPSTLKAHASYRLQPNADGGMSSTTRTSSRRRWARWAAWPAGPSSEDCPSARPTPPSVSSRRWSRAATRVSWPGSVGPGSCERERPLRAIYDAANRGDFGALVDRPTDDVEWRTPTRTIRGRNAVVGWLTGWHTSYSPRHTLRRFVDDGDHVIVLVSIHYEGARTTGRPRLDDSRGPRPAGPDLPRARARLRGGHHALAWIEREGRPTRAAPREEVEPYTAQPPRRPRGHGLPWQGGALLVVQRELEDALDPLAADDDRDDGDRAFKAKLPRAARGQAKTRRRSPNTTSTISPPRRRSLAGPRGRRRATERRSSRPARPGACPSPGGPATRAVERMGTARVAPPSRTSADTSPAATPSAAAGGRRSRRPRPSPSPPGPGREPRRLRGPRCRSR